jgi:hypothetical protein
MRAKPPYDGTGAALIFKPTYNWFTKRIPARPGHAFATIQSCKITKIGMTI